MNMSNPSGKKSKLIINVILLFFICSLLYCMGQWTIPFIIALVLSYAFHVPCKTLSEKLHISSTFSAGIIVSLIVSVCTFFTIFMIPLIKNAILILMQKLPKFLESIPEIINNNLQKISYSFGIEKTFDVGAKFQNYILELVTNLPTHLLNFINTGMTLVYIVMFLFMTPIITFYLLKDWRKIENSFQIILKKVTTKTVIETISNINVKLGAYIRGQLLVCCVLSILYITFLFFIGTREYIICGIFSGFLSFAPFFGPFIGLLTTLAMSIDDFSYSYQYITTCCIYVIIPFIDSNFITPKLIGKRTGIQPFWLLFSICATVSLLGTIGIFISVPLAVVFSTVCKDIVKRL